jgi:hypothetical protein
MCILPTRLHYCSCSRASIDSLREMRTVFLVVVCGQHTPPTSTCVIYYLWGTVKCKVHKSNTHSTEELKENIRRKILCFSQEELQHIIVNIL